VRRLAFAAPLLAALALRAAAGRSPSLVERGFSRGLYAGFASRLTCLTGLVPFSLAEALVALLALACLAGLAGRYRRGPGATAGWPRRLRRLVAVGGWAYLAFLLVWGLNYQREPLAARLALDARPATFAELEATTRALVDAANRMREGQAEDADGVLALADGRRGCLDRVAAGFGAAAGRYPVVGGTCLRPKPIFASALFSWLGISGIYSPFTGEANVNVDAPDPDLPFSACHEAAHQRGLAREDEANYAAYLVCRLHPDGDFRYAGVLAASQYAVGALAGADRGRARGEESRRSPAVARDLAAIRAWVDRHRGPAMAVSERVNDAYLRSQGQHEGTRSYGRMVDLLIAERRAAP